LFKFFTISLQIILVILIALVILNYSFVISFEINDFIYSIPSTILFVFLLVFFLLIFLIQSIYFKTKFKFSKYKVNKIIQKKEKGYNAFVNGMIALANRDFKKAITESKKTSNYLSDDLALTLLLKSEVYKIEKKFDDLNLVYQEMAKNKSTENLAFRGMMEQYLRLEDFHHAFIYAEKLFNNNPYIEKIYDTLVNIISKTNNWQQLLFITDKAFTKKIIEKKVFQENKSIAFFEIAKINQYNNLEDSINYMEKALRLRKNFPPYIKLYIDLLVENKNYNLAKKFLKKAWNENPHPDYRTVIINLAYYLKVDSFSLIKDIIGSNVDSEDSKILLVEASIESKKWENARNHIKGLLDIQPKKEVCLLMAKIEEGDTGDIQKVNSWTLRAKNGKENNIWVCMISNKSQNEWSSISRGGFFNSLEWKQPYMLSEIKSAERSLNYES